MEFRWGLDVMHPSAKKLDLQISHATNMTQRIDNIVNACSLAIFSGLLWQFSEPRDCDLPNPNICENCTKATSARDLLPPPERMLFSGKVKDIAGRGVTVRALLDFTESLLQQRVMPSFDPQKSTTNDVVREAIIPLSRQPASGGGVAMATVWNEGEPVYPVRMVTHNWSNTFMHLVAAVVAESLDSDTYYEVAELLITPGGLKDVIARLESEGRLDMTFWICAFSINQHASICGGFGEAPGTGSSAWAAWDKSTRNTVTGKMYPTCNCTEVKYFNNQPGLCELNKFDDVMRFLRNVHQDTFAQVVVVDAAFQVFFRAWCVAEIIEGNNLRIKTAVKIPSEDSLNSNYDMLAMLDVQDCESTHKEDKEMILAKITDIHVFNLLLQEHIFGAAGLLSHWIDYPRRVGRIVMPVMMRDRQAEPALANRSELPALCPTCSGDCSV